MSSSLYPLLFTPVYKDYLWGGQRMAARYARQQAPAVCAESWEISAHAAGMSTVANGPFAGTTLADLAARLRQDLTGTAAPAPEHFPLLFKLIDARDNLSVQVHPADDTAGLVGGEAKAEMWWVVDRAPGAVLYAGLKPGTTPATFHTAMSQGDAPSRLFRLEVNPGEALFIPGGLVHAIGAGCLIYEVQQSSNTTYRLYDWGRFDSHGQPRTLHIQHAFQVIDTTLPAPCMIPAPDPIADGGNHWTSILACAHFRLRRLDLRQSARIPLDGRSFQALFVPGGPAVTATAGGVSVRLAAGVSSLVPAGAESLLLEPANGAPATLLVTTLN